MLKLVDVAPPVPVGNEADGYIPMNVVLGTWEIVREPTWYWRTGDLRRSLLEVGVASRSGRIRSLTLVLAGSASWDLKRHWTAGSPERIGLPVVELGGWPENGFLDEPGQLDVHVIRGALCMAFLPTVPSFGVVCGPVRFGVDGNSHICAVEVTGLDDEQLRTMRQAMNGTHTAAVRTALKLSSRWLQVTRLLETMGTAAGRHPGEGA